MDIRPPRLGVVLIAVLIGWGVFAPLIAYVAGHTEGYVLGLHDVQKVMHQDPPPAFPVFPPPPRHLQVAHPANGSDSLPSASRLEPAEGLPQRL
jgi:hypothetical protein